MIIIYIAGAKYIFLLFSDYQDTESESCEIEVSISQPISTYKNITSSK